MKELILIATYYENQIKHNIKDIDSNYYEKYCF